MLGIPSAENERYYIMQGAFMAGATSMLEVLTDRNAIRATALDDVNELLAEIESFEPRASN
jgi:hypothetical protein